MDIQQAIEHAREVAKCKRAEATNNFPTLVEYYNECKKCADEHEQLAEWLEELKQYERLGTLEEVQEAVDKQNAKKPDYEGDGYAPDGSFVWDTWVCPGCGTKYEVDYDDYDYCPNCGQHIDLSEDWSEEDD